MTEGSAPGDKGAVQRRALRGGDVLALALEVISIALGNAESTGGSGCWCERPKQKRKAGRPDRRCGDASKRCEAGLWGREQMRRSRPEAGQNTFRRHAGDLER